MSYDEQLKHPLWFLKRDYIIERDFGICQHCMSGKSLQVHHIAYINGRMAWDYPDYYLITLCKDCHGDVHKHKIIPIHEEANTMWDAWDRIAQSIGALMRMGKGIHPDG